MDEKTFFEEPGVKVTNARFLVNGQTYVMQNVTSVKTKEEPSSLMGFGLIALIIAAITAYNSAWGWALGLAAVGALCLWAGKATYHVLLTTSGGETSALTTQSKEYLQRVVVALNDAIVSRG
jgi:hypothetical protein